MSRSLAVLDPTPTLAAARHAFDAFVDSLTRDARTVALHDSDADGVTAGVVWQRAFDRAGHGHDQASGGSLPMERGNELLAKLGFSSKVFAVK